MFHGSIVALVTPMFEDGEIDWSSLNKLIQWHIEAKTAAIVILGTTGEAPTISPSEREQLISHVIKQVADRLPVIVGTGANSTATAMRYTKQALELGAAAAMVVTPYYNKPTQAGLLAHYQAVAKAAPIPMLLYNVPGRTGVDLLPETVAEIAATVPSVIGIKDATGDLERLKQLKKHAPGLKLFSGDDGSCLQFIQAGGDGVVSVTANVAPTLMAKMAQFAFDNDNAAADKINAQLAGLHQALFIESNPIVVKWLLAKHGHIASAALRLPLTSLSESGQARLAEFEFADCIG